MKIRVPYFLLVCLLITGCMPVPQARYHGGVTRRSIAKQQRPDAPVLKRLANGHYKLRKPWTVVMDGRIWQIPAGYSSNGITAPANIKASLGDGIHHPETWAAVFHDWLFTQKGASRTEADRTFHELLIAYGVPSRKASLMYTFVSAYSVSKSFR